MEKAKSVEEAKNNGKSRTRIWVKEIMWVKYLKVKIAGKEIRGIRITGEK
ncbi:hypothetical protein [Methanosarcina sp.]|nr:hypothetical protein [Methanosarcina sp.]MDY9926934.1 hypothetical protein [Methanosarcina sp.]